MSASSPTASAGLTLILGPANSGKLGRVLEWWEERRASRPLLIVPTGPDARGLSAEMAQRSGGLVGQSPAVTFDGLVRLLLGRSPRYAGDFERSLLISHLLHDNPPRTPGFSARLPGMSAVAASLLEQLGDSGRSTEEIARLLHRWASVDEGSALLAADISGLLKGYRGLRDRLGLADRSDSLRAALAAAGDWRRPLALYGFTSFTLAQRRLITALAQTAEVVLVFDHERSRPRGLTAQSEFAAWAAVASQTVELTPRTLVYTSPAIAYLERHFMGDGARPDPPPAWTEHAGVRFLLASGQRNEAELAAAQVADLIRSGFCPGEIAIVVRHMKAWGGLLGDVFASCGIPCQVDERLMLDETGLGHAFLTGLLGVAQDDPTAVLKYLRSPFSGLTLEQAGDLELDYRRQTTRGVGALERCAHPGVGASLDCLVRAVRTREDGLFLDLDAAGSLACRMLENALRASSASPGPDFGDAVADSRALRALQDALSSLSAHQAGDLLPAGMLRLDVLLPALRRMAVAGGALGSEDAVQVLTVHRARARRFQAVLILGLVEGEFPGRADRPSLLTQTQRDRLDLIGGGLFSPDADQEEALFVRAISRAWRVLLLSSRDADDGGGYIGRSYYWSHCKDLLGVGERDHTLRTLADQVFDLAGAPSARQYLRACAARGLEPHPDCALSSRPLLEWTRSGERATLASGSILDEMAGTQSLTPSAIESYLRCPFIWFVEKVVGAKEMETVVDDRLLGHLLHKALSDTYQDLKAAGVLPLRSHHLPLAERTAGAIIEALVDGEDCPGTASERRLVEWQLKRMAANLFAMEIAAASPRTLDDTELKVGGKSGVDVGGLAIRGRIDRVDSSAGGELFIIDYKSRTVPAKGKIATAEGLQLPLYMLALAGERPGQRVVGGAYLSPRKMEQAGVVLAGCESALGTEARSFRVVDEEGLNQVLEDALGLAREAAEGIRSGRIAPLPDRSCPSWCRLGTVCRARTGGFRR